MVVFVCTSFSLFFKDSACFSIIKLMITFVHEAVLNLPRTDEVYCYIEPKGKAPRPKGTKDQKSRQ